MRREGGAQAGLALNPAFKIARTYPNPASDNPTFFGTRAYI